MNFRNNKSAASKSKDSKKPRKTEMTFVKLNEVEEALQIEDGEMWLKSGKYDAPSVSVKIDPEKTVSDWMRKITLRNVVLTVEENERGFPELVISGHNDDAGDEDLPF